jgi:hypothetical protein
VNVFVSVLRCVHCVLIEVGVIVPHERAIAVHEYVQ